MLRSLSNAALFWFIPGEYIAGDTSAKIKSFRELRRGWSFGEGVSFKDGALSNALALQQEAFRYSFFRTDAFPGADGEIMFTIYSGDDYLEFTVERDGTVTFFRERESQEVAYEEGLTFETAKARIRAFREESCRSSASLISSTITTTIGDGSPVWLSGTAATNPESQSSIWPVFVGQAEASADIFESIMRRWPANPQFIGASP